MQTLFKFIIGGLISKTIYDSYRNSRIPMRRIFISHSWKKGSRDYLLLTDKLKKQKIKFYNHSIPIDNAFDENKRKELEKIFRKQMVYCSKVFVLANSGIKKDSFVMTEIRIAKEMKKKIIAVKPYGQNKIPSFIKRNADKVISNNIESLKKIPKINGFKQVLFTY